METVRLNGAHKIGDITIPYIFTHSNNAFKLLVGNPAIQLNSYEIECSNLSINFSLNSTKISVIYFDHNPFLQNEGSLSKKEYNAVYTVNTTLFTILDVEFIKHINTAKEAVVIDVIGFYLAKILVLLKSGLVTQHYNNFVFSANVNVKKTNGIINSYDINIHHSSHVIVSFRVMATEQQTIIYRGDNSNKTVIAILANTSNLSGLEFARVFINGIMTAITSYENGNTTFSYLH